MSYTYNLLNKIPDSIFTKEIGSNNEKLWRLFSQHMDEVDQVFEDIRSIYDFLNQAGANLDLVGKIVREKRNGKSDENYIKYLAIAIQKILSDGSIDTINNILESIFEDNFLEIRELTPSQLELQWSEDEEYRFWLDGSYYLDGRYFFSGDVFQPAFFEIRINEGISENLKQNFIMILENIKGAGIAFRIIEV